MADYIEKQAVIDLLKGAGEASGSSVVDIELTIEAVRNDISAADVAPVVRGHWLTWDEKFPGNAVGKNLGVFCSVCGNHSDYSSPYCANCGAKLDKEDTDEKA